MLNDNLRWLRQILLSVTAKSVTELIVELIDGRTQIVPFQKLIVFKIINISK